MATLESAFRTTVALRDDARLPFVVGPIASIDGQVLRRLGQRYAVSVFPYLDVEPGDSGEFRTDRDRDEAMRMFGRVHNATGSVPVDALRQNTLVIQDRDRLLEALNAIEEPWTGGPYAEPARDLLRAHAREVRAVLGRFDALSGSVMGDDSDWVITHGEPHAANVVRSSTGDLVVVDWDTVAFAPRERDLWMLVDDAHGDWSAYRDVSGVTALSGEAMWAYRMHWSLSEIAVFTGWCRDRHERTGDMEVAWTKLQQYVKDIL